MNPDLAWLILGMAAVTAVPRILPLVVLNRRTLPDPLVRWLRYVPPAVLGALLAQDVFVSPSGSAFSLANPKLLPAIAAALVGVWSRNLMATVLTGVAAMALMRAWF